MMKKNGKQENRKQGNRKQKVAVIFTGGTIGSRMGDDGWISPNQEQPYALIDLFQQSAPELAEQFQFDCCMPYQILSEQLDASYLNQLIREVDRLLKQPDYHAIMICHGTDTLQYTAAMLGILFQDSRIPIYLVSSNYPLESEKANGLANFLYAVRHMEQKAHGVMVSYRNADGNTYLHEAVRLLAHQTFEDNIFSMHQEYLGYYDRHGTWMANNRQQTDWKSQTDEWIHAYSNDIEYIKNNKEGLCLCQDTSPILWLRCYPGMPWRRLDDKIQFVILESYHSGTICIDDGLRDFLRQAQERRIPVYVTGVERMTDSYETIRHYEELGLCPMVNIPPITLFCLLWLKISRVIMRGTPRIAGADRRWQTYRKTMTDYVKQTLGAAGHLLILGAGGCDDVDVITLLQQGWEVYLADVNIGAMTEVYQMVVQKDAALAGHLHLIETDFVGITEQDYRDYDIACMDGIEALKKWWNRYYERIQQLDAETSGTWMFRDIRLKLQEVRLDAFDGIVCLGVHSQLYIGLIRNMQKLQAVSSEVQQEAVRYVQTANAWIAREFIRNIRSCGRNLILGLEYTDMIPDGGLQEDILHCLTTHGSEGLHAMNLSRVEGAVQMEQYLLEQSNLQNAIQDYQYVLWPFSEEKTYLMIIYWLVWENVV